MPLIPVSGSLGVAAGVEGGLQDAGREDDPVLGGQVVGIDGLRGHAPPGAGRWGRGQAGMCALSTPPRHSLVLSPNTCPLLCPAQGWHCCPCPMTKGPCPRDKPEPPLVSYNAVLSHGGSFPRVAPRPCWGQCCDTMLAWKVGQETGGTLCQYHILLPTPCPPPYWSRLGGFRSWSAITLAEKL